MIKIRRRWMTYTYYNSHPRFQWGVTHLFSFADLSVAGCIRIPFPTLVVELSDENFLEKWSSSTRTKVNRAVREELVADRGAYLMPDILKLFSSTALLKGLHGYSPRLFKDFPQIECSAVLYEGVMLCGHVWVIDPEEKRALLYVNASNQYNENEDSSLTGRAHYFLLWQDGLHLRRAGIQTLDLMGYDPQTTETWMKGINQWKAGTHGREELLHHYYPFWFYFLRMFRAMFTR